MVKVKTTLSIFVIFSAVALTFFGIYVVLELDSIGHIDHEIDEGRQISIAALDFNVENFHTQLEMWEYAYDPNQKRLTAFKTHQLTLNSLLDKWESLVLDEEFVSEGVYDGATDDMNLIISNLRLVEEDWLGLLDAIVYYNTKINAGAADDEIKQLDLTILNRVTANEDLFDELQFNKNVDRFVSNQREHIDNLLVERNELVSKFQYSLFVIIPTIIIISLGLSLLVYRQISLQTKN